MLQTHRCEIQVDIQSYIWACTMVEKGGEFEVVDLSMMKKHLFLPISGLGSFTVQTMLYPLILLRTRLQLQEGSRVYRGLFHAVTSIIREEGIRGLYSGYFIKSVQVISSVFYATTYETIRHGASAFPSLTSAERSFIGGAFASVVAQTLVVPVDIVSQHLMVLSRPYKTTQQSLSQTYHHPARPVTFSSVVPNGRMDGVRALTPIRLTPEELSTSWSRFKAVTRHIASTHGILGFYHGYLISLGTFVPSSALWWAFYDKYCRWIACLSSKFSSRNPFHSIRTQGHHSAEGAGHSGFELPRLSIQLLAAPLAGVSAATLCNPVDCVRVRMQVGNIPFVESVRTLWVTEGIRWFVKGLSARLIQTGVCSFWLILIYEPVKLFCLKDEFRDRFGLQSPENSK